MKAFLLLVLSVGCARQLPETDLPCPCASGWACCPGANICVKDVAVCASVQDAGGIHADAGGGPADAGCTDACALGTRICSVAQGEQECRTDSTGCTVWAGPFACQPQEVCGQPGEPTWTCDCGADAGCVSLSDIVPQGPFEEFQSIELIGDNFDWTGGGTRVAFDGVLTTDFYGTNSVLYVTIPAIPRVEALPRGTLTDVVMTLYGGQSGFIEIVQRVIQVGRPVLPLGGAFNVVSMGSDTAVATGELLMRYRLLSRANQGATVSLSPGLQGCSSCSFSSFLDPNDQLVSLLRVVDSDGGYLPNAEVYVDPNSSRDFAVRIAWLPVAIDSDGGTIALRVGAAAGGLNSMSTYQRIQVNQPLPQPLQTVEFFVNHALRSPDGVRIEDGEGFNYGVAHVWPGGLVRIDFEADILSGTYDVDAGFTPETHGWTWNSGDMQAVVGNPGAAFGVTFQPTDGGTSGEFDVILTERVTGASTTLQLGLGVF